MNERQLQCFLAVYDCGTTSRAAERLFLGQPTVSYQIRSLEKELGVDLFDRTQAGLAPTEEGRAFEPHARAAAHAMEAGVRAAHEALQARGSTVRVCHCQSIHDRLYGAFIAKFSADHPGAHVVVTLGLLEDEMTWPEADVYIIPAKVNERFYPPRTHHELLYEAWTYAIVDAGHPLAGKPTVSIDDCQPYTLNFPSKAFMDRCDNWYWPYIHSRLDRFHPAYHDDRTVHDMQLGIFGTDEVFFSRGIHTDLAPGLVQIPFTHETPRLRTMICTRLDASEIVKAFSREMRAYYRERAAAFVPQAMRDAAPDARGRQKDR